MNNIKIVQDADGTIKIVDSQTGTPLGGITKLSLNIEANNSLSKASIEVMNVLIAVDAEVSKITPTGYGKHQKALDDLTQSELYEALEWEARQRYIATQKYQAEKNKNNKSVIVNPTNGKVEFVTSPKEQLNSNGFYMWGGDYDVFNRF